MNKIRVQWSEKEPAIAVSNADELEPVLNDISADTDPNHPTIVFVEAYGYRVGLGLGSEKSFVQFEQESGDPPYIVTVGDASIEGAVAFYLFGEHHTEIPRRNLIPTVKARKILHEWTQTAIRPTNVKWEEI